MGSVTSDVRRYHTATGYVRGRLGMHRLDWANRPRLSKIFAQPSGQRLPEPAWPPAAPLAASLRPAAAAARSVDAAQLAAVCALGAGVTARKRLPGGTVAFRSPASAGALYPTEVYLGCNRVAGLAPGLYHYDPERSHLTALRSGAPAAAVAACLHAAPKAVPMASVIVTGILFRSAWKYRARALRYVLLDGGHLIANLQLAGTAFGLGASLHYDFDDGPLARLLGVDERREVCLAVLNLYATGDEPATGEEGAGPLALEPLGPSTAAASRVAPQEVFYEEIRQVWEAGRRPSGREVRAAPVVARPPTRWRPLAARGDPAAADFVDTLAARRSRRNFVARPLAAAAANELLHLLCDAWRTVTTGARPTCGGLQIGFAAVAAEGFDAGVYLLDPVGRRCGQVRAGGQGAAWAAVCLDQQWLQGAGLHVLFMADLDALERDGGARAYRYALLQAGGLGQSVYLAATALGLGACGIGALYDGEAAALLGLTASSALLYLVAVGEVRRRTVYSRA